MILTCPSCATRYSVDDGKFPAAGRQVRCAKCGHAWFQPGPTPIEPETEAVADHDVHAAPAPVAEAEAAPAPQPGTGFGGGGAYSRPQQAAEPEGLGIKLAVAAGWAGLIAVVLLTGYSAVRYREEITLMWPQTASVYAGLGMRAAPGLDIENLDSHHESEDGQVVLAVTGQIINHAKREMPVPDLQVTLSDASNHELYHWNFAASVQTLKAGGAVAFTTRLSSPPPAARHLEVRFAKDGP